MNAEQLRGRTGVVDVAAEFTDIVPNTVISRITGIPAKENDEARFRQLARDTLSMINPFLDDDDREVPRTVKWFLALLERRQPTPTTPRVLA